MTLFADKYMWFILLICVFSIAILTMNLINIGNLDKYCPPKRKVTDTKGVDEDLDSQTFLLIRILNWIFGSLAVITGVYLINLWHERDDYKNELKTTLFVKLGCVAFLILSFVSLVCSSMTLSNITHDAFSCSEDDKDVTGNNILGIQHQSIKTLSITILAMCIFLFIMSIVMVYDVFFKKTVKQKKDDAKKALDDLAKVKPDQFGTKSMEDKLIAMRHALEEGAALNDDDKSSYDANILLIETKIQENGQKIDENKQKLLTESEKLKSSIEDTKKRLDATKNFTIYKDMFKGEMTTAKKKELFKYLCENAKNTHFKDLVADDAFYKQRKEPIAVYCKYGDEGYKELENFVSWTNRDEGVKGYLDHLCSDDSIEKDEKDIKLKSIFMIESYKELIKTKYGEAFKAMVDRNGNLYDDPFFKLQQGGQCKKPTAQPVSQTGVTELAVPVAKEEPQAEAKVEQLVAKVEKPPVKVEPAAAAGQANVEPAAAAGQVKKQTVTTKTPFSAAASSTSDSKDPLTVKYQDSFTLADLKENITKDEDDITKKGFVFSNYLSDRLRSANAAPHEKQLEKLWFSSKKNKNKK